MSKNEELRQLLIKQADEIASEGHNGWANTAGPTRLDAAAALAEPDSGAVGLQRLTRYTPGYRDDGNGGRYLSMVEKESGGYVLLSDAIAAAPAVNPGLTTEVPGQERKLSKPAKVGAGRFMAGVPERLVVEAAQRLYEYEVTPEKEAERIAQARRVVDALNAAAAPAPEQGDQKGEGCEYGHGGKWCGTDTCWLDPRPRNKR